MLSPAIIIGKDSNEHYIYQVWISLTISILYPNYLGYLEVVGCTVQITA